MLRTVVLSSALACALLAAPARAGVGMDSDGDGVLDAVDNCTLVPNAAPADCDTDNDGYGNACDGDFDNLGSVNAVDFSNFFLPDFQSGMDSGIGSSMNCTGAVSAPSFSNFFLPQFTLGAPGPSCCAP